MLAQGILHALIQFMLIESLPHAGTVTASQHSLWPCRPYQGSWGHFCWRYNRLTQARLAKKADIIIRRREYLIDPPGISVIYIYPLLFRFFSHKDDYRVLNRIPRARQQVLIGHLFYIYLVCICPSQSPNSPLSLLLPDNQSLFFHTCKSISVS